MTKENYIIYGVSGFICAIVISWWGVQQLSHKPINLEQSEKPLSKIDLFQHILIDKYGFVLIHQNPNPNQFQVQRMIGNLVTLTCEVTLDSLNKLKIEGIKNIKINDDQNQKTLSTISSEIFESWFNCLRILDDDERHKIYQTFFDIIYDKNKSFPHEIILEISGWALSLNLTQVESRWKAIQK